MSAELRDALDESHQQYTALLEEHKRKSFFLNALSHDLRTPLNALTLQAALAKEMLNNGDLQQAREALDEIQQNAQGVADLLCSLLEFARMELSTEVSYLSTFEVGPFVQHLVKGYHHVALRKGLVIQVQCLPLCTITCDRVKLFRVLSNLTDNALKFTTKGSVSISATCDSEAVAITVADTGSGIPDSFKQMLFQEFAQAGNSERDRAKGFGLGLAITRKLVIQLEGVIDVSSDANGSRFTITLPLNRDKVESPSPDCGGQQLDEKSTNLPLGSQRSEINPSCELSPSI